MAEILVVAGGGAAGFFCAINAARLRPGLRVVLLEKSGKLLGKVRISGGGRCNVTHDCSEMATMASRYPRGNHFVKKAFHRFFTTDTIKWFTDRGVPLVAEKDGRMFPVANTSQAVIDCLLTEAKRYGVEIKMHAAVKAVSAGSNGMLSVLIAETEASTTRETTIAVNSLCMATGGNPNADALQWLRNLGHAVEPAVPSLFTFNLPGDPVTGLMGVSVQDAQVKIAGTRLKERGPVLITHWGLSGPAILRLSAWGARDLAGLNYRFTAVVNWLPGMTDAAVRETCSSLRDTKGGQKAVTGNPFKLPQRLWEHLVYRSGITENMRWADLPAAATRSLVQHLTAHEFGVSGKTTFKEEFVTAGGIRLSEIDPQTMQSKIVPGLYFAGEIMDVDGITGGYNFQHAWTSGFIAAESIARQQHQPLP